MDHEVVLLLSRFTLLTGDLLYKIPKRQDKYVYSTVSLVMPPLPMQNDYPNECSLSRSLFLAQFKSALKTYLFNRAFV